MSLAGFGFLFRTEIQVVVRETWNFAILWHKWLGCCIKKSLGMTELTMLLDQWNDALVWLIMEAPCHILARPPPPWFTPVLKSIPPLFGSRSHYCPLLIKLFVPTPLLFWHVEIYSIQLYVIKFATVLRVVHMKIKMTDMMVYTCNWNIVGSGG